MGNHKVGHQAPKGWVINKFNSIEIEGDLAYCRSHNFVYNSEYEKFKLYNAIPNYYTDIRFKDGRNNFYKNTMLHWTRWKDISLKACIRKALACKGIPKGTVVSFKKSYYHPKTKVDNSFRFKVKKVNKLDIQFEINDPRFSAQFTKCEYSQQLTTALRENGFIVSVVANQSFLLGMMNSAIAFKGGESVDAEIEGETATAYGHGKKIGFSSFNDDFLGYSNGCDNILWEFYGNFNKWSQCVEIPKHTPIDEIIEILMIEEKVYD